MRRRAETGFALVAVLWILIMVAALSVAFQAAARAERRAVANARAASRARWAARAGLARAVNALDRALSRGDAASLLTAGSASVLPPVQFQREGVAVRVLTLDTRARVHLNRSDGRQLRRLLTALGLGALQAEALADVVLDWRDPDSFRRRRGAEAMEYAALQPPSRPKNAQFDAVDELRHVFGVTPRVYRGVAPYLTVSGDGRVNVNTAPAPVLNTLPGVDAAAAAVIVARRRSEPYRNPYGLLASLPRYAQEWIQTDMDRFIDRVAFSPREIEIVASTIVEGSPVGARLRAVVHLQGGSKWRIVNLVEG